MFQKTIVALLLLLSTSLWAMNAAAVNKASKEELMQIKGVGEAKADAIIAARKAEAFKTLEELTRVKGVGPALVQNIKNDVKSTAR